MPPKTSMPLFPFSSKPLRNFLEGLCTCLENPMGYFIMLSLCHDAHLLMHIFYLGALPSCICQRNIWSEPSCFTRGATNHQFAECSNWKRDYRHIDVGRLSIFDATQMLTLHPTVYIPVDMKSNVVPHPYLSHSSQFLPVSEWKLLWVRYQRLWSHPPSCPIFTFWFWSLMIPTPGITTASTMSESHAWGLYRPVWFHKLPCSCQFLW